MGHGSHFLNWAMQPFALNIRLVPSVWVYDVITDAVGVAVDMTSSAVSSSFIHHTFVSLYDQ